MQLQQVFSLDISVNRELFKCWYRLCKQFRWLPWAWVASGELCLHVRAAVEQGVILGATGRHGVGALRGKAVCQGWLSALPQLFTLGQIWIESGRIMAAPSPVFVYCIHCLLLTYWTVQQVPHLQLLFCNIVFKGSHMFTSCISCADMIHDYWLSLVTEWKASKHIVKG